MQFVHIRLLGTAVAVLAALTLGCGSDREPEPTNTQDKGAPSSEMDKSAEETEQDEVTVALAELSPADRKLAMAQKVCPVSGQPLGSMGTPIKMTVKGQEVFICCRACRKPLEKNPDKYLAKMRAK